MNGRRQYRAAVLTNQGREVVRCSRCGRACRISGGSNPEARLMRHGTGPCGYCPDCAATQFLKVTEPAASLLRARGPEILRAPMLKGQFARILAAGFADARPGEIDWEAVIAHWDLPIAGRRRSEDSPLEWVGSPPSEPDSRKKRRASRGGKRG